MRAIFAAVVGALLLATATPAHALKLMGKKGFDIYSVDNSGGGWVIHRGGPRGDTLWGCADVKNVDTCQQLYFSEWKPAAKIDFLHINEKSQAGWMVMKNKAMPDVLFSCTDPEGSPVCEAVELEMHMKLGAIDRAWPDQECDATCARSGACGGYPDGDCSEMADKDSPAYAIESGDSSDIWIEVGPMMPGPANLYACTGLGAEAACQLALPNWLAYDREKIGFKKVDDIETEGPNGEKIVGPGAIVSKVDEETVAWDAGFREGMKVMKVGGFEVKNKKHMMFVLSQYPAETTIVLELGNGETKEIAPRRKPKKK